MAGDWFKVEIATPDKPEIEVIGEICELSSDAVLGKLIRLFAWIDTQMSAECNAKGVTKRALDRITNHDGFAEALLSPHVRWLELVGNGPMVRFLHFERHNGKTAKKRCQTNRRVSNSREVKRKCNAESVTDCAQKALPEKRREEKSIIHVPTEHSSVSTDKPTIHWLVDLWNETVAPKGLAKIRSVNTARIQAFNTRSKDASWLQDVPEALKQLSLSDFCLGKKSGSWKANIDWFLKPSTVTKLMEGHYDNNEPVSTVSDFTGLESGRTDYDGNIIPGDDDAIPF